MNIREIPKILFEEFSQKFGVGEEKKMGEFLVKNLNCGGAIGFRNSTVTDKTFLTVWPHFPEKDTNLSSGYSLEIMAGSVRAGIWTYGQGDLMQEAITADFPVRGLNLNLPIAWVIVMILARVVALAQSPILPKESWWEVEHHPDGNYTKP